MSRQQYGLTCTATVTDGAGYDQQDGSVPKRFEIFAIQPAPPRSLRAMPSCKVHCLATEIGNTFRSLDDGEGPRNVASVWWRCLRSIPQQFFEDLSLDGSIGEISYRTTAVDRLNGIHAGSP